jgi:hypothetical protein
MQPRNILLPPLLLALLGACGGYTQPPLPAPAINSFTAAKTVITAGDSTSLTADFVDGAAVIDQGVGPVVDDLPVVVQPAQTTTYTLTDSNAAGDHVSRSVTVVVVAAPAVPVIQPPASVGPGQTGLEASVTAQDGCTYQWTINAAGGVITAGAQSPAVTFSTAAFGVLTLTCTVTNAAGQPAAPATLTLSLGGPNVTISANPATITAGESSVLEFSFSGGTGVLSAPGLGDQPIADGATSYTVTPAVTTTYTFTVTDSLGQAFDQPVTVTVVPAPVITQFNAGPGIIGTGATTYLDPVFDGGSGAVEPGVGAVESQTPAATGTLEHSTTFTLTVTNAAGKTATATTRVLVGSLALLAGVPSGQGAVNGTEGAARYNGPAGVVQDASGNLLVADTQNHTIRLISSTGQVSTLAGQEGDPGSADGVGGAARFNLPMGLAIDRASGIRQVAPDGTVSTLAGSAGHAGGADGQGSAATPNNPTGIALGETPDGPAIFVADTGNATIRRVGFAGLEVTTLAGIAGTTGTADGAAGTATFGAPAGLAWDATDSLLFVADAANHSIRQVTLGGEVTTVTAPGAGLADPQGVALSADDATLYVADTGNSVLDSVALPGGAVSLLAGTAGDAGSTDTPPLFDHPQGLTLDGDGNLLVADTGNATIRQVTAAGQVSTLSGQPGTEGSAAGSVFSAPYGIAVDPATGNITISVDDAIMKVDFTS